MNESKIPVRYARALFKAAENSHVLPEVAADVRQIQGVCQNSEEFILFLQSPVVKKSQKIDLMDKIFKEHVHPLTMRFLLLLSDNRREEWLPGICRNYLDLMQVHNNISPVVITTAEALVPEVRENIIRYLNLKTEKTIDLSERVNPEIIGGLILRIGDLQYDGSISNQLKKIKGILLEREL
jgi:F-type H+-transporting ATPase subunit delta